MRARHLLAPAAVAAVLAACGGERGTTTDTTASLNPVPSATPAAAESASAVGGGTGGVLGPNAAGAGGSLADPSTTAQLDSVQNAARSGLTSLPVATAVPLIRSLEQKLRASTDADLRDIGDELGELAEELGKSPVDGREIGETLSELGPKVTRVASKGGAAQSTLTAIGSELTRAGTQLRGRR